MTYTIKFRGRLIGAIGIFQDFEEVVVARDFDEAVETLYETYQDISIRSYCREEEKGDFPCEV